MALEEHELRSIYSWVDELPLSRPKRNIHRDFADGVMVAEILSLHMPKMINLHNYSYASRARYAFTISRSGTSAFYYFWLSALLACSAMNLKLYNWRTLDERVFGKLGCALPPSERQDCASAKPGAIERVLRLLQQLLLDKGLLPEVHVQSFRSPASRQPGTCEALSEPCPGSPTSHLEAAVQTQSSHGSGDSSSGALQEGKSADPAKDREAPAAEARAETAAHPEDPTMARAAPFSRDGAESVTTREHMEGLQDMTGMSVELVEGALGESADFLIATYGMGPVHKDTPKPAVFSTSAEADLATSVSAPGLQQKAQELERRVQELEVENEQLKRVLHLHKQRCSILEEACLANGVHVPGGLLARQHV